MSSNYIISTTNPESSKGDGTNSLPIEVSGAVIASPIISGYPLLDLTFTAPGTIDFTNISDVKNFPEDDKLSLEHLILSYQGRKEWQSPVEPQTLEAILLHSINFIDSKINFMRRDES